MNWKVGDWCIFDLNIVQIKRLDDWCEVSDGLFNTSGNLRDRLRELTLRNKSLIENFEYYYSELRKINGSQGFNYPRIANHFHDLSLKAIDEVGQERVYIDQAGEFVNQAREYKREIQGIQLFREH